jgi:hypothetical protein
VDTTIVKEVRTGDPIATAGQQALRTREERALVFYRERGGEVTRMSDSVYRVPSFSRADVEYVVDYDAETCTCPPGTYRPSTPCQHVLLVGVINAKRRHRARRVFIHAFVADDDE